MLSHLKPCFTDCFKCSLFNCRQQSMGASRRLYSARKSSRVGHYFATKESRRKTQRKRKDTRSKKNPAQNMCAAKTGSKTMQKPVRKIPSIEYAIVAQAAIHQSGAQPKRKYHDGHSCIAAHSRNFLNKYFRHAPSESSRYFITQTNPIHQATLPILPFPLIIAP